MTAAHDLPWLEAPWQFFHPEPGNAFVLNVIRHEVGLAMREVSGWPEVVTRRTIRLWVEGPVGWGLRPYVDVMNQELVGQLEGLLGAIGERPLRVGLVRHGRGRATNYTVRIALP